MLVTLGMLADAVPLEWRWMLLVTSGTRDDEQFVSGSWVRLTLTDKVKVKTLFVSDNPPQKRLTSDFWLHWIWGCLGPKVWILSNPALIRTLDPKVWAPLLVETKQTLPRAVGNKLNEMVTLVYCQYLGKGSKKKLGKSMVFCQPGGEGGSARVMKNQTAFLEKVFFREYLESF